MIKLYGYNNIILYTCEYIYYALDDHCITYMSLCAGFAIVKHKIYKISTLMIFSLIINFYYFIEHNTI